jgi:uncharacterized protein YndB with AHSA1/START domain
MRISASVIIDLPIREVFALAANPSGWPAWMTGVSAVQKTPDRYMDVGSTFEQTEHTAGYRRRSSWQVIEYQPPHVWAGRRITEPSGIVRQVFESVEHATRLTLCAEADSCGPFTSGPEMEREIAGRIEGDLGRLKGLLERRDARLDSYAAVAGARSGPASDHVQSVSARRQPLEVAVWDGRSSGRWRMR